MRVPAFKIEGIEPVREGTHKVYLATREGQLRVVVYPGGRMLVMSNGPVQWLQSDLSSAQQKQIMRALDKSVSGD